MPHGPETALVGTLGVCSLCYLLIDLTQITYQALEGLTNGVLRDVRVVGLGGTDWISKYNNQGALSRSP